MYTYEQPKLYGSFGGYSHCVSQWLFLIFFGVSSYLLPSTSFGRTLSWCRTAKPMSHRKSINSSNLILNVNLATMDLIAHLLQFNWILKIMICVFIIIIFFELFSPHQSTYNSIQSSSESQILNKLWIWYMNGIIVFTQFAFPPTRIPTNCSRLSLLPSFDLKNIFKVELFQYLTMNMLTQDYTSNCVSKIFVKLCYSKRRSNKISAIGKDIHVASFHLRFHMKHF